MSKLSEDYGRHTKWHDPAPQEVTEEEFNSACESAQNLVRLSRLRKYLRPILAKEAKGIAQAAARGISDFEAMKRATERLREIEDEP